MNYFIMFMVEYDEIDKQGKAAFNERNPYTTQQQEPVERSPGGHQTRTGQLPTLFQRYI
jgi:hypothetical protein